MQLFTWEWRLALRIVVSAYERRVR